MDCLYCHEEPKGGHDLCGPCQTKLCPLVSLKKLPLEKRILEKFSPSSSENKENNAKHINRKRKIHFLLQFYAGLSWIFISLLGACTSLHDTLK